MNGYTWKAPKCGEYQLFNSVLDQYNTLIAGCVGSGKSVFEEGMIYNLVNHYTPEECELYFIDPKMVELDPWRVLPHCSGYADSVDDAMRILRTVKDRMDRRYEYLKENHMKNWEGGRIYVFIDEMADLILTGGKEVIEMMTVILLKGRAAAIRFVCCSQSVSRKTIPSVLQVCMTCTVGLHCRAALDSRMIIKEAGCEKLPLYGKAMIDMNGGLNTVSVPMYTAKHTDAMRRYWMAQEQEAIANTGNYKEIRYEDMEENHG